MFFLLEALGAADHNVLHTGSGGRLLQLSACRRVQRIRRDDQVVHSKAHSRCTQCIGSVGALLGRVAQPQYHAAVKACLPCADIRSQHDFN